MPRAAGQHIMLIDDTLAGWNRPVSAAITRHLKAMAGPPVKVTRVDLFEDVLPGVSVLARLAHQRGERITPSIMGGFAEARDGANTEAFFQELDSGGLERLHTRIHDCRPGAILCVSPLAAALATEVSGGNVPVAGVVAALSVQDMWFHPSTELQFVMAREVRDDLVMRGLDYKRVVVTGAGLLGESDRAEGRTDSRLRVGLSDRFTAALSIRGVRPQEVKRIADRLAAIGVQVVTAGDGRSGAPFRGAGAPVVMDACIGEQEATAVSDVVVAGAGTVLLLHSVCAGVPSVIYNPSGGGDIASADFLVNIGASLAARDDDDTAEKVRFLSSHPERLMQMASDARKLGKGNGTKLICERVVALCD